MLDGLGRLTILCGQSGVGKTNLALNLALALAGRGEAVTLIDLDIVNPYFRSSDYPALLARAGVRLIAPQAAGSTLDLPALSGAVAGAVDLAQGRVLIDAGGDSSGTTALGRFAPAITRQGAYDMFYLINLFRAPKLSPQASAALLQDIQRASHLYATAVLNNTHLSGQTAPAHIQAGLPYARAVCAATGLPLACSTAPRALAGQLPPALGPVFYVDRLVRNPWE